MAAGPCCTLTPAARAGNPGERRPRAPGVGQQDMPSVLPNTGHGVEDTLGHAPQACPLDTWMHACTDTQMPGQTAPRSPL